MAADFFHEIFDNFEENYCASNNRNCDNEAILSEEGKIKEIMSKRNQECSGHDGNNGN